MATCAEADVPHDQRDRCYRVPTEEGVDPFMLFVVEATTASMALLTVAAFVFVLWGMPPGPLGAGLGCTSLTAGVTLFLRRTAVNGQSTCYSIETDGVRRQRRWGADCFVRWDEIARIRTVRAGPDIITIVEREGEHPTLLTLRSGQRMLIQYSSNAPSDACALLVALHDTPANAKFDLPSAALLELCRNTSREHAGQDTPVSQGLAAAFEGNSRRALELFAGGTHRDGPIDDLLRATCVFHPEGLRETCTQALQQNPDYALARYYLAHTYSWPLYDNCPFAPTALRTATGQLKDDLEAALAAWRLLVDDAEHGDEARRAVTHIENALRV